MYRRRKSISYRKRPTGVIYLSSSESDEERPQKCTKVDQANPNKPESTNDRTKGDQGKTDESKIDLPGGDTTKNDSTKTPLVKKSHCCFSCNKANIF